MFLVVRRRKQKKEEEGPPSSSAGAGGNNFSGTGLYLDVEIKNAWRKSNMENAGASPYFDVNNMEMSSMGGGETSIGAYLQMTPGEAYLQMAAVPGAAYLGLSGASGESTPEESGDSYLQVTAQGFSDPNYHDMGGISETELGFSEQYMAMHFLANDSYVSAAVSSQTGLYSAVEPSPGQDGDYADLVVLKNQVHQMNATSVPTGASAEPADTFKPKKSSKNALARASVFQSAEPVEAKFGVKNQKLDLSGRRASVSATNEDEMQPSTEKEPEADEDRYSNVAFLKGTDYLLPAPVVGTGYDNATSAYAGPAAYSTAAASYSTATESLYASPDATALGSASYSTDDAPLYDEAEETVGALLTTTPGKTIGLQETGTYGFEGPQTGESSDTTAPVLGFDRQETGAFGFDAGESSDAGDTNASAVNSETYRFSSQ